MIELRELNPNDGRDVYDMLQRIGPSENAFRNEVNGMSYDEYKEWLALQHAWSKGERLPDGYVKQWTFWLYDGNTPVGYGKLREKVTDHSRKFGGNMGLAVDPNARGKGYGNILFAKLIEAAREKNIEELFSTVEKFNYASKKIHENNGGVLVDESDIRWFFTFPVQS